MSVTIIIGIDVFNGWTQKLTCKHGLDEVLVLL